MKTSRLRVLAHTFLLLSLSIASAIELGAQAQSPYTQEDRVTVAVTVVDMFTGKPISGARVYGIGTQLGSGTEYVHILIADSAGIGRLQLFPGDYTISAQARIYSRKSSTAHIVRLGEEEHTLTLKVHPPAGLSGNIETEDGDPAPFTHVNLVERIYHYGRIEFVTRRETIADDLGHYEFADLPSGESYLVMATALASSNHQPVSDVPADPDRRRAVLAPTYYPDADIPEAAQALVLRDSESRENINIKMGRSPNYCISGTLTTGGAIAEVDFDFLQTRPMTLPPTFFDARLNNYRLQMKTDPNGAIRLCGLSPGEYSFVVYAPERANFQMLGMAKVTITDRDVERLTIAAMPRIQISGEIAWDRAANQSQLPEIPAPSGSSLRFNPIGRDAWRANRSGELVELQTNVEKIPTEFSSDAGFASDYTLNFTPPTGAYLKDITHGGRSILYQVFNPSSAPSQPLRVILGADGGSITTRLTDEDGQMLPSGFVAIFPTNVTSQGDLANRVLIGQLGEEGSWTTPLTAPGAYYVIGNTEEINLTFDSVEQLWRSRSQAERITLAPNGTQQVNLEIEE